ncbi:hypothetical protein KXJ80_11935 [Shewanella xiamenensis]|nr:hypothetical protein [Shewanella xiamenensis]MCT8872134.1 hypothetical protein [Shewanella xiamenensis]MCT8877954.1 hypothetical protein [Shewanella xiamenensis]UWH40042.1 hypothetical protein KXJ80_11935 [Shewanella xiamenensis]
MEMSNTFYEVKEEYSQEIFRLFTTGSVINKCQYMMNTGRITESPFYLELLSRFDHYKLLYRHLGYELLHDNNGEFYSLRPLKDFDSDEDQIDETSIKIVAILTLISKEIVTRGQRLELLENPVVGLTSQDLDSMANDDKCSAILSSLKLKSPTDAVEFLRKRGFAFKVSDFRLVLSRGAMSYIDVLIQRENELKAELNDI